MELIEITNSAIEKLLEKKEKENSSIYDSESLGVVVLVLNIFLILLLARMLTT